jgi:hypothetical protein
MGRPSAQNARECGASGDLPGFRNWQNDEHVAELGTLWKVKVTTIPHYSPPTHAMQMFRYAERYAADTLIYYHHTNAPVIGTPPSPAPNARQRARPAAEAIARTLRFENHVRRSSHQVVAQPGRFSVSRLQFVLGRLGRLERLGATSAAAGRRQ